MDKSNRATLLMLFLPAVAFIVLLFVYPFVYGPYLSFTGPTGSATLANYAKFFTDWWEARTIFVTLWISVPATLINMTLAIPFAYYMRRGLRGEKIITFFLIVPITLGTVLISEGMLTYLVAGGDSSKPASSGPPR